jgi:predicted ATP-grasp superfamily ATP-dependent carboligase
MLLGDHVNSTFLFAETHSRMPDSRASAEIIRMLDLYLNLKIDPKPLVKQAEEFENKIKEMIKLGIDSQQSHKKDEIQRINYLG